MSDAAKKLVAAVLELPLAERLELMDALAASIPEPAGRLEVGSPEFDAELNRRRAEHENGTDPGMPAADFFRELRAQREKRT